MTAPAAGPACSRSAPPRPVPTPRVGGASVHRRRADRGPGRRLRRAQPDRRPGGPHRPARRRWSPRTSTQVSSGRCTTRRREQAHGRHRRGAGGVTLVGRLPWEERAAPFLRAADMLQHGPWRDRLNAATMLELSKTTYQADIDAACETVDFIRANVKNMLDMYDVQPASLPGMWNQRRVPPARGLRLRGHAVQLHLHEQPRLRPRRSWATRSSGSRPRAPRWSRTCRCSCCGRPGCPTASSTSSTATAPRSATSRSRTATSPRVHFTGSTGTFQHIWRTVGANIAGYRNYPRIVGETGGKDFIVAHPSADVDALAVACVRGAYEYQGQKCSAASRLYAPRSLWPALRDRLVELTDEHRRRRPDRSRDLRRRGDQRASSTPSTPTRWPGPGPRASSSSAATPTTATAGSSTRPSCEVDDPHSPFITEELFAPGPDRLRLRRRRLGADAAAGRRVDRRTALTGAVFAQRRARGRAGRRRAALHGRQLLRQRQAHRLGRRPAAVRRRARVGHQRQGRHGLEPDPVRQPAVDQAQPPAWSTDYRYPHLER